MRAAFYKGTHSGINGAYNVIVRAWDSGPYSHCELIFSDGVSASASFIDGGVRFKQIEYDPANWDFIELPDHLEPAARAWFEANEFQSDGERTPYDLAGNFGFVWRPLRGMEGAFFCSESMAAALGFPDAWRYSPNGLASALCGSNMFFRVCGIKCRNG